MKRKRIRVGLSIFAAVCIMGCETSPENEPAVAEKGDPLLITIDGVAISSATNPKIDFGQRTYREIIPNLLVTVSNTSDKNLFISRVGLHENSRFFNLSGFVPEDLPVGESLEFEIELNTGYYGKPRNKLQIEYDATGDEIESESVDSLTLYEFRLQADISYPLYHTYIDGNQVGTGYYIGSVADEEQLATELRLDNYGAGELIIDSVSITGPNWIEFGVEQDFPLRIPANGSADVTILFESITGTGTKYATIAIQSNSIYLTTQYIDIAVSVD